MATPLHRGSTNELVVAVDASRIAWPQAPTADSCDNLALDVIWGFSTRWVLAAGVCSSPAGTSRVDGLGRAALVLRDDDAPSLRLAAERQVSS